MRLIFSLIGSVKGIIRPIQVFQPFAKYVLCKTIGVGKCEIS